jgi:hypothetical protein
VSTDEWLTKIHRFTSFWCIQSRTASVCSHHFPALTIHLFYLYFLPSFMPYCFIIPFNRPSYRRTSSFLPVFQVKRVPSLPFVRFLSDLYVILSFLQRSVDRSSCCWSSPAQSVLISGPVGTHDHIFVLSKIFTCFEMGPSLREEEGSDSSGHSLSNWPSPPHTLPSTFLSHPFYLSVMSLFLSSF